MLGASEASAAMIYVGLESEEHDNSSHLIFIHRFDLVKMLSQDFFNGCRFTIASPNPDNFGRKAQPPA